MMLARLAAAALLLPALLLFCGCGEPVSVPETNGPRKAPEQQAPSARPTAERASPPAQPPEISEAEQQSFAAKLEAAGQERDASAMDRLVAWDRLVKRMAEGLQIDRQDMEALTKQLVDEFRRSGGFATMILSNMGDDGSYEFLRLHERDGFPYALFRWTDGRNLNYHDWRLGMVAGDVRATDVHILAVGEHLSEFLQSAARPALAQHSEEYRASLSKDDEEVLNHYTSLSEMRNLVGQGRAREALQTYQSLPESMKNLKAVQIARYEAATRVGPDALLEAFEDLRRRFPGDDALAFRSIDSLTVQGKYDQVVEAINNVDQSIGGDPRLSRLKVVASIRAGQPDRAVDYAREYVERAPDSKDAQGMVVVALLEQGDHDALYQALTVLEQKFGTVVADMTERPVYQGFVASQPGKRWLREHGDATPQNDQQSTDRDDPYLTWSDATGKFSVEAKLLEADDENVRLQRRDGKVITVPLSRLSEESRRQAG